MKDAESDLLAIQKAQKSMPSSEVEKFTVVRQKFVNFLQHVSTYMPQRKVGPSEKSSRAFGVFGFYSLPNVWSYVMEKSSS